MTGSAYERRENLIRSLALAGKSVDEIMETLCWDRRAHVERIVKETLAGDRIIYPPAGDAKQVRQKLERCPGCGAKAYLPCLACQVRAKNGKR